MRAGWMLAVVIAACGDTARPPPATPAARPPQFPELDVSVLRGPRPVVDPAATASRMEDVARCIATIEAAPATVRVRDFISGCDERSDDCVRESIVRNDPAGMLECRMNRAIATCGPRDADMPRFRSELAVYASWVRNCTLACETSPFECEFLRSRQRAPSQPREAPPTRQLPPRR